MLLHSRGAKTGREVVTPLLFTRDAGRYVIIASMGGWKRNPDWYYNLIANPDASIEVGTEVLQVTAVEQHGATREALFARQSAEYPQFDYYQGKTTRVIPVIVLEPVRPSP